MHSTAPTVSLLRDVLGMYSGDLALENRREWGVCIPVAEVVVEVRCCTSYCHPKPIVVETLIVFCYTSCLVLMSVVDLHNSDAISKWVMQSFFC